MADLTPKELCELQASELVVYQKEFSTELFESGTISRLLLGEPEMQLTEQDIDNVDSTDLDFFERFIFVPAIGVERRIDSDNDLLNICIGCIAYSNTDRRGHTYYRIGDIDPSGVLVYPHPNRNAFDVELVFSQAQKLQDLRDNGKLPNLNSSLVKIDIL